MNWKNIQTLVWIVVVSLISSLLYNLLPGWIYALIVIAIVLCYIIDWEKFGKKNNERDTEEREDKL